MNINDALISELNLLSKFNDCDHTLGIKVHSEAGTDLMQAAQRLFDKGLTTASDGGYLTDRGKEVVDHFIKALRVLNAG